MIVTMKNIIISTNNSIMDIAMIEVMILQEKSVYNISEQDVQDDTMIDNNQSSLSTTLWRKKMIEWCYQLIEFGKLNRVVVEIAMSYVDRFFCETHTNKDVVASIIKNVKLYQLVCMTALYTAMKIHAPKVFDPVLLSKMSRGTYKPHDFERMERILISALQWHLNPPTPSAFMELFLNIQMENMPLRSTDPCFQERILRYGQKQIAQALLNPKLITTPASQIAFGAFMNALQYENQLRWNNSDEFTKIMTETERNLSHVIGIPQCDSKIIHVRKILYNSSFHDWSCSGTNDSHPLSLQQRRGKIQSTIQILNISSNNRRQAIGANVNGSRSASPRAIIDMIVHA